MERTKKSASMATNYITISPILIMKGMFPHFKTKKPNLISRLTLTLLITVRRGTPTAACGEHAHCWCCRCVSNLAPCKPPHNYWNFTGSISASVPIYNSKYKARHDFGSVTTVQNKDMVYFSFNSSESTVFSIADPHAVDPLNAFTARTSSNAVVFRGIPNPGLSCGSKRHPYGCPFRTGGRGFVRLQDGVLVMSIIVRWGHPHSNPDPRLEPDATSVIAFRSRDDGYTWDYAGVILDAAQVPKSEEGPNENDLVLLADNRTIMCVVRLDAGDGFVSHPYRPYMRVLSTDGGKTWTNATSLNHGVGSARPRLLRMDDGQIVLSGGRNGPKNRDTMIWLNADNEFGLHWEAYSITYWHNMLEPNASLHFDKMVNDSSYRETMSYTSLLKTGPQTGLILYGRKLPDTSDIAFSMPFVVDTVTS